MITAGLYHTLTVSRITAHGLYLSDGEGQEVLLPNRFTSLSDSIGDSKRVFVYHDSEDRLVATTETPLAVSGECAYLLAADISSHGTFMDWGLSGKQLFVPLRNQTVPMRIGCRYVVYLYTDRVSSRVTGTMRLGSYVRNDSVALRPADQVRALVARRVASGFRCVVENRYWGMIYDDMTYSDIHIGDTVTAFVQRIAPDGRIDLSMAQFGMDQVIQGAETILSALSRHGGELPLSDKSSPESIRSLLAMSKKGFKRSVGHLLRNGDIELTEDSIRLRGQD